MEQPSHVPLHSLTLQNGETTFDLLMASCAAQCSLCNPTWNFFADSLGQVCATDHFNESFENISRSIRS